MSMTQCRLFSMAQWLRMTAHLAGQPRQRGDVEAGFAARFCRRISRVLSTMTTLRKSGPIVAFLQPGDIVDDGIGSGLDAAVIAIDRLVPADPGVLETVGFLLGGEELDVLAQACPDCL